MRGSRRAVGLASEGPAKLPPRNDEAPGEPEPPTAGYLAVNSLDCPRPSSLFTARAVRSGARLRLHMAARCADHEKHDAGPRASGSISLMIRRV